MGHSLLDTRVRVFANDRVWMEDAALQQLHTTAGLAGMRAAVGLPDLHPGRGYPVGAAFFSVGRLYPALVGGDIGCGMALYETELRPHKTSASRLAQALGCIDGRLPDHAVSPEARAALHDIAQRAELFTADELVASLGTIGGGNHFAELQVVDQVHEPGVVDAKRVHLLVHSGSRGLGSAILRAHIDGYNHGGLAAGDEAARQYLAQHDAALAFAELNRAHIAQRMAQALRTDLRPVLALSHNHVLPHVWGGEAGFLHRKGATPADQGLVVIPGSRGDHSHVLRPVAGRHEALDSLAHGAGRKWARADCRGRLKPRFSLTELLQTRFGSAVVCADKALVYEEAPQAYKDVDAVVATLIEAGLVVPVARLRPLLTYKKGALDQPDAEDEAGRRPRDGRGRPGKASNHASGQVSGKTPRGGLPCC
ncbi:RNA ligase RtcB family protein [Comamonas serinivorans]|uniref:tRNA-splicing ligase RtcB n=1 Tax=Comamonas serinivorans TaxID=1082851 RepID=A0A1Y0EJ93_9BURK|nr:RNA ligase RtcB family protein [Comamonas serinivorans]ARU03657.1 RNA ligase RtcB family protein [Comamonas serinivorans]